MPPVLASQVKGVLLVHLRTFVNRFHDAAAWRQMLKQLPPADQAVLDGIVLVGSWYPVGAWNRAVKKVVTTQYPDPGVGMSKVAGYIARQDLGASFRLLLKLGSPEFLLRRTRSIWGRYFDAGAFTAVERGPNTWHASLTAPIEEDGGVGEFTCSQGIEAWLRHALELTGARATVAQTRCRFQGHPNCEYVVQW